MAEQYHLIPPTDEIQGSKTIKIYYKPDIIVVELVLHHRLNY